MAEESLCAETPWEARLLQRPHERTKTGGLPHPATLDPRLAALGGGDGQTGDGEPGQAFAYPSTSSGHAMSLSEASYFLSHCSAFSSRLLRSMSVYELKIRRRRHLRSDPEKRKAPPLRS